MLLVEVSVNTLNYRNITKKVLTRKGVGFPITNQDSALLLTVWHVVQDADDALCSVKKRRFLGEIYSLDQNRDVALLNMPTDFWQHYNHNMVKINHISEFLARKFILFTLRRNFKVQIIGKHDDNYLLDKKFRPRDSGAPIATNEPVGTSIDVPTIYGMYLGRYGSSGVMFSISAL